MSDYIHQRIPGRRVDGCFLWRRGLDEIGTPRGSPAAYVKRILPRYIRGDFAKAQDHIPHNILQVMDAETGGLGYQDAVMLQLGTLSVYRGEVVAKQFIMTSPLEEKRVIDAYFAFSSKNTGLVTFNGKAFDETRLRRRAREHGHKQLPFTQKYDVLKAFRRFSRRAGMDSARLMSFEEVAFPRFERKEDVPGRLIPPTWAEYVDPGSSKGLYARLVEEYDFEDEKPGDLLVKSISHCVYDILTTMACYLMVLEEQART